jgi:hypothetical protein
VQAQLEEVLLEEPLAWPLLCRCQRSSCEPKSPSSHLLVNIDLSTCYMYAEL